MATWRMILRKPEPGTLDIMEDRCEAKNAEEASKIFNDRHGPGRVVAGPFKVS